MAKRSISKLFRRPALPPDVQEALERLSALAEAAPELRDAAAIQAALLRAAYARPPVLGAWTLDAQRAAQKRYLGEPLLSGEELPLDAAALGALLNELCAACAPHIAAPSDARAIADALRKNTLSPAALAAHALNGTADELRAEAAAQNLNGELLGTLLRFALFPALSALAAQLAPLHGTARWEHGFCPTCGGAPLLAEQRGLEQLRFLRCGQCAGAWQADRLFCPFCGTRDHKQLAYLHTEDEEQRRAATCDTCHGYIKVLATLAPLAPAALLLEDLATLHLDMIALERGYGGAS